MDYQPSSRSQKKRSPTGSDLASSSRPAVATTSVPPSLRYFTAAASLSTPYESPYAQDQDRRSQPPSDSSILSTSRSTDVYPTLSGPSATRAPHSKQSSSSSGGSLYDSPGPGPRGSRNTTPGGTMSTQRTMSSNDREQLIRSLRTHRVNTLTELRRIEKLFASNDSADVTEAMTTAWAHYVNSNNLLSELRGMTKNYPFSSECLDEAKWQVIGDPSSGRSWNYCWLILTKIKNENLIRKHARLLAVKPTMWGGRNPSPSGVDKLCTACEQEWTRALNQMLRQWSTPPSKSGR